MNTNSLFTHTNGNAGSSINGTTEPNILTPLFTTGTATNLFRPEEIAGGRIRSTVPGLSVGAAGRTAGQKAVRIERPLIIIATGGSGRWVATQIKADFLRMFGAVPENAALLAFDSGAEVISVRDIKGRTIQLENGSEFYSIGKVPIGGIKRNPDYQVEMVERLGDSLRKISRQSIVDGCSQNRNEGIATFYYHFDMIHTALKRAIQHVTMRNDDVDSGVNNAQKLNIVLVGSMAGGQGSGILLDVALLLRELLAEQGGWEDTAQLTGFFLLPSAFNDLKERDKKNMGPNTVAFMQEMEMLQRSEPIAVKYPNRVQVRNLDAPFDHVYVLEGIDERGYVWQSQRDIAQMAARAITLLTAGQVGMAEIAFSLNQHSVLTRTSRTGYRSYLASLGLAEIYYPGDLVVKVALLRHLHAMLVHALRPMSEETLSIASQETPPSSLEQLRSALQNGISSRIQIQLPDDLRDGDPAQIPPRVRDFVARYKTKRVYDVHYLQMDQQASVMLKELHNRVERQLARLANQPSLTEVLQSLRLFVQNNNKQIGEVQQARKACAGDIDLKKRAVTTADVAMVQAAEGFPLGRRTRTLNAANQYVDEAEQLLLCEVSERELSTIETLLHKVDEQLQGAIAELEALSLRLQGFANRCQQEEQRLLAAPSSQNVVNLADPELIHALYQHHAPASEESLQTALVSADGWWKLASESDETMLQHLQGAATPAFETLSTLNVEDVLHQRWPERSAEAWVKLLTEKAAVAWNVDRAKLPPGAETLAQFMTLGVPNSENSMFGRSNHACTSTGDPQRIIALRTVYGGSIDSLKSLPRWEAEYRAAIKAEVPVHLFGSFEPNKERVVTLFGLGLLFNFLRRNKTWFIYQPQDVLDKSEQVAQGVEKTLETLGKNGRLLSELEQRIHTQIAEIGNAQAALRMEQWVEQNHDRSDELFTAVVRAVRSYAEGLK